MLFRQGPPTRLPVGKWQHVIRIKIQATGVSESKLLARGARQGKSAVFFENKKEYSQPEALITVPPLCGRCGILSTTQAGSKAGSRHISPFHERAETELEAEAQDQEPFSTGHKKLTFSCEINRENLQ